MPEPKCDTQQAFGDLPCSRIHCDDLKLTVYNSHVCCDNDELWRKYDKNISRNHQFTIPSQVAWEYITWCLRTTQANCWQHLLFVDM